MELEIRFTPKGKHNELLFTIVIEKEDIYLYSQDEDKEYKYKLKNDNGTLCLDELTIPFEESPSIIEERLMGLSAAWIESKAQGFENESGTIDIGSERPGYGPDDIFVENKPFSLKQIVDLIADGDIDLSPDFQRNFIWDKTRQSRLIESIFLGLPLPSIYLSQYDDGKLTVVDGLQRLSTIKRFMDDELILLNLEYLQECNGLRYSELGQKLSPLRLRRFGQTQIMCFVIDYRSPSKLKFDLFRRLNTGGKPLNNQEIRNCLSRPGVQQVLKNMVHSEAFGKATSHSVKDTRMESQETALRFMFFYEQYREEDPIGSYNGNMDDTLDAYVDQLNTRSDLHRYIDIYHNALLCAEHFFGEYTFRKVFPDTINARRTPVNKLLMLVISILMTRYKYDEVRTKYEYRYLLRPIAELISTDSEFFRAITWSTNSRWNIETAFKTLKRDLIDKYLR